MTSVLDKLKIGIAPYLRNTIIGHGNRLGRGSLFEGKSDTAENTYKIGGKVQTLNSQNNQDYFKIAAFVEKILKRELGGANKTNQGWDNFISEILHVLKYDSFSNSAQFRNILEIQIKQEIGFNEAKDALTRLESQGEISKVLDYSEVDGLEEVVEHGDFGKLKNEIIVKESEIYGSHSNIGETEKLEIEEELKEKKQQGIAMQEEFKKRAKDYLNAHAEELKQTKQRCKELSEVMRNNPENSDAYKAAVEELRKISIEKKDLFDKERDYKRAVEEIRDLKKTHEFAPTIENTENQREF